MVADRSKTDSGISASRFIASSLLLEGSGRGASPHSCHQPDGETAPPRVLAERCGRPFYSFIGCLPIPWPLQTEGRTETQRIGRVFPRLPRRGVLIVRARVDSPGYPGIIGTCQTV